MTAEAAVPAERAAQVSLGALARYFLRLGTFGFGGPIALTAAMQRDLVLERRWVTAEEYKEGLALAQLAPGPLAAQLAIYLGWVRQGVLGATLVGLTFVGPSFLMVLVLSAFYLRFGELAWMQGAFYGIGAAVIAIVARGTSKLLRSSIGRDPLLWAVVVVNAAVVAWTEAEILWVLALSGLVVLAWRIWSERGVAPGLTALSVFPLWLVTGLHGPATGETMARILGFFAKAAIVVFGSGLAVVPFLHGGVVRDYGWLTERQFLDAVAVSMITPGPVVITVAFIGYLVAGPARGARSPRSACLCRPTLRWSWRRPGSTGSPPTGGSRRRWTASRRRPRERSRGRSWSWGAGRSSMPRRSASRSQRYWCSSACGGSPSRS